MTTTSLSAPRLLPWIMAAFFVLSLHACIQAQSQADQVEVPRPLTWAEQPVPGQTFDLPKYAPEAIGGSSSFKHIIFSSAKVGKFKDAKLEIHLDAVRVTASTLTVQGPKSAKRLRKALIKRFGEPFNLTVSNGKEVLSWKAGGPFKIISTCDAADTYCTATLEKQ
jgi:hypothetical protein